jgi:hypothetical protein
MMFWYGGGRAWWQAGLMWLAMIAFWALLIWAVYALVTGITRKLGQPLIVLGVLSLPAPSTFDTYGYHCSGQPSMRQESWLAAVLYLLRSVSGDRLGEVRPGCGTRCAASWSSG